MKWAFHYLLGIIFLGLGLGLAVGWPAIPITFGICLILGGVFQFALEKISAMTSTTGGSAAK